MTARERALSATVEDGDLKSENVVLTIIDCIESAGLVLVDRELHEALVEAVRARVWADARGRVATRYAIECRMDLCLEQDRLGDTERDLSKDRTARVLRLLDEAEKGAKP